VDRVIDTVAGIAASLPFFAGFLCGLAFYWGVCRFGDWRSNRRDGGHRRTRMNPVYIAGGLVFAFILFSVGSTHEADRNARHAQARAEQVSAEAVKFAEETRRCQKQLLEALQYNRTVTIDNDDLSLRRFIAVASWMHDLVFPPDPVIAALAQDDPRRVQWGINRTTQADAEVRSLIEQQQQNAARRAPYPPPTCGS